jgi:hypothetical protein
MAHKRPIAHHADPPALLAIGLLKIMTYPLIPTV